MKNNSPATSASPDSERRSFKRFKVNCDAMVFGCDLVGNVVDISLGGVKISHAGHPCRQQKQPCLMTLHGSDFYLEDIKTEIVTGVSAEENIEAYLPNQCCMKFNKLSAPQKRQLEEFIARNSFVEV